MTRVQLFSTVVMHPGCSDCGRVFDTNCFYVDRGRYRNICKTCHNARSRNYHLQRKVDDPENTRNKKRAYATRYKVENAEKLKQKKLLEQHCWKEFEAGAKKRGIQITDENYLRQLMHEPCFFCGFQPSISEHVNGIDRINGDRVYSKDTAVTCCAMCNRMKGGMNGNEFVHRCRRIYTHKCMYGCQNQQQALQMVYRSVAHITTGTASSTIQLSAQQVQYLREGPCSFCNRTPCLGIDRIDSFESYIENNVQPCCTICNLMKNVIPQATFEDQVVYIQQNNKVTETYDNQVCGYFTQFGLKPVVATTAEGIVCFPSARIAARVIGCAKNALYNALHNQVSFRDASWVYCTHEEYNRCCTCETIQVLSKMTKCNTNL